MFRKKNRMNQRGVEDWMAFEENGNGLTLKLSGELGSFKASLLENTLQRFIRSHKNASLWIDLSEVSAIVDPQFINVFIQAHRKGQKRKVQLQLLCADNAIRQIFTTVKAPDTLFAD